MAGIDGLEALKPHSGAVGSRRGHHRHDQSGHATHPGRRSKRRSSAPTTSWRSRSTPTASSSSLRNTLRAPFDLQRGKRAAAGEDRDRATRSWARSFRRSVHARWGRSRSVAPTPGACPHHRRQRHGQGTRRARRSIASQPSAAKKPFIEVNCAAIPSRADRERTVRAHEGLVHRGDRRIAPASSSRPTRGTLFLDEIGDMSRRRRRPRCCACCRTAK
jgi:hypothetical protein